MPKQDQCEVYIIPFTISGGVLSNWWKRTIGNRMWGTNESAVVEFGLWFSRVRSEMGDAAVGDRAPLARRRAGAPRRRRLGDPYPFHDGCRK
jgi:hypothetical protein